MTAFRTAHLLFTVPAMAIDRWLNSLAREIRRYEPAGPRSDYAKLAARLRYAPPHVQLGATAGPALTLFPDQQSQAVHFFGAGLTMLICGAWLAACLDRKQPEKK